MTQKALRDALESMAAMPGLEGCALVEIEAGMVWHHAGQIEGVQTFAEAASDYWRLYNRLSHQFKDLGDLKASVMMHAQGRITLGVFALGLVGQFAAGVLDLVVAFLDALLEGVDAFADLAHQVRDLATPKQHQHHNRNQQKAGKADIVQHISILVGRDRPLTHHV